jgi:hypothetical protein
VQDGLNGLRCGAITLLGVRAAVALPLFLLVRTLPCFAQARQLRTSPMQRFLRSAIPPPRLTAFREAWRVYSESAWQTPQSRPHPHGQPPFEARRFTLLSI